MSLKNRHWPLLLPLGLSLTLLASCATQTLTGSTPTPVQPSTPTRTPTFVIKSIPCPALTLEPLSRFDTDGTKLWGEGYNRTYKAACA